MGNGSGQLNVAHPFPADLEVGYFYPATVADDPFIPYRFEFTAVTFPFFRRSENPLTEKAVLFRSEGPVINGFRLFYFPV
jgi:hypothetical protein